MACLDNIVTLGVCPDEGPSTSGITLLQAAGISPKNLAQIATEQHGSGTELAMEKKALALTLFTNDFIGTLQANKVVTQVAAPIYSSSSFDTPVSVGTYAGQRGVALHKVSSRGSLRKTIITEVECYPLASGEGYIYVHDGRLQYDYPVSFVANQINSFELDFEFPVYATVVKVLIDQTDISFASAPIICHKGCSGRMPNDCAWADGWDGTKAVKSEGYGINLKFKCECDYTQILCDLAKSYSGELIWLKWQYLIFDEQYKSDRFNNWVVYNREDLIKNVLPDLEKAYNQKWNQLMDGILGILNTYRDDCLNCRGIRWLTNI